MVPADQPLTAEQFNPGMIGRVPTGSGLEGLAAADLKPFCSEPPHDLG
jgi:hypothetical protein